MNQVIYKNRKNTNSMKWDGCEDRFGREDLFPLWIADMDFEVPECVKHSLKEYIDFGVFGYYKPPKAYFDAFIQWEKRYHHYEINPQWIRFAPGVVPSFNWLIHILTKENDGIIVMSPVYYPFFDAVINNNRTLIESRLLRTEQGYMIDYDDFEQKIIEYDVKLFIMCSPHNPVGRVWKKEELKKVLDICQKHHVYVIADEIHQDIIMKGYSQISAATTGDYDHFLITVTAATKTFNLASCQNSFVIIPDEKLRAAYDKYLVQLRIKGGNAFGYIAVQSAYENGREWLEEVLDIIEGNYWYLKETLQNHLPKAWISPLEGTYLTWIDLSSYMTSDEIEDVIQNQCKLAVDFGSWFGGKEYAGFIRINLATSRKNIEKTAATLIDILHKNTVI